MKTIISKKHGVVNTVSEDQYKYLMKSGDYEDYTKPEQKQETNKAETPKRKRRTKAEIEADKLKGK